MFPDADRDPSGLLECCIGITVAADVRLDLLAPELRVALGPCPVGWAAVPEAAIYEDRDLRAAEHHIASPAKAPQWPLVDPVSQAAPV